MGKKVLHCLTRVEHGGVERRRAELAESKSACQYEHVLICESATSPLKEQLENSGWRIHEIGQLRGVIDVRRFRHAIRLARAERPDLIHGAVSEGNIIAFVIALFFPSVPLVLEETSDLRGRRMTGHLLVRLMALRAQVVLGVAPQIVELLRERSRINPQKLNVITNGVVRHHRVPAIRVKQLRRELGLSTGDFIIGSSGRLLDSHKRFSDLIRVTSSLLPAHPTLKLLIVGDGPDRAVLSKLASELNIEEKVIFAGYRSKPRELLEMMDIFALVSSGEALPLALAEAMHAGLPCLASAVGGVPEMLDYGAAGALVNPGELDQIRLALNELIDSEDRRKQLGRAASKRAASLYSSERYHAELLLLWNKLLPRNA